MEINLDAVINEISYNIIREIEEKDEKIKIKYINEIEKALGVLSNDGIYAYFVYVKSKNINDIFLEELKIITKFINNEEVELNQEYFNTLSQNLSDLLFFREILEKILIYSRYHAKAMGSL